MNKIKYGLRNKKTKKLMQFDTTSNDGGEFCNSIEYSLSEFGDDGEWLVDSPEHAEWVRLNSTEWYSAGFDTPSHKLKADDYEVVMVEIVQEISKVDVKLPTPLELAEMRYAKTEPGHLAYLKGLFEKGEGPQFSWHDYSAAMRVKRENEIKEELKALHDSWLSKSGLMKKSQDFRDRAKVIADLYGKTVSGELKIQQLIESLNVLIHACGDDNAFVVWYTTALREVKNIGKPTKKVETIKLS